jgi:SMC interacting uncharacterized protein involved in chromosome segregation
VSNEYIIDDLEDQISDLQDTIQSLSYDIELMKLEIVERGDVIKSLVAQNNYLKKQLMKQIETDVKIPAILKPIVREGDGEIN